MALTILPSQIQSEARFPFTVDNPADTVDAIVERLRTIETEIDSAEVNSEVVGLSTGGVFFGKSERPCLNIKLRDSKVKELQRFGCAIIPVMFGNLVYLVKYEYIVTGWGFTSAQDLTMKIKSKLKTIDQWMEYTFIQTLGDYVYVKLLREYEPNFDGQLDAFRTFFTIE